LVVGTAAAESVTGFDEAHALTIATDAGKNRSLSFIGILLEIGKKKAREERTRLSSGSSTVNGTCRLETIPGFGRIQY